MDCLDFVVIRLDPFRSPSESEEGCFIYLELKFIWVESHIVLSCCVMDIEYSLVMLHLTHNIDECVSCNATLSIQSTKDHVHFLLRNVPTTSKARFKRRAIVVSNSINQLSSTFSATVARRLNPTSRQSRVARQAGSSYLTLARR